jgi:hypothetical protein
MTAMVISLIFLGFQLMETTRATQSATASSGNDSLYASLDISQKSSTLINKYSTDFDSLSKDEQFQVMMNLCGVSSSPKRLINY